MVAGRPIEWNDEKIEIEAEYLLEWVKKDDSLVLGTCYGSRGYSYHDCMEWEVKNEKFRHAKRQAKTIIGARREKGAILNELNSGIVNRTMGLYDCELDQYLEKQRSKEQSNDSAQDICNAINALLNNTPTVVKRVENSPNKHS